MGEAPDEVRDAHEFEGPTGTEPESVLTAHPEVAVAREEGDEAAQIRSDIGRTRAELSETVNALQEKLEPARLKERVKEEVREKAAEAYETAKNTVREATVGRAEKIMANVSETVAGVTERAGTAVKDSSSSFVQYIRENPVPFTLVGVGLGMLALNARRGESRTYGSPYRSSISEPESSFADRARETASGAGDTVREAAGNMADRARAAAERTSSGASSATAGLREAVSSAADTTRQQLTSATDQARQGARVASDWFSSTLQENPLALGVAALAAGALFGLTLPSTRIEGEYMGEAREHLVESAKSVAQETAEKVQRVTQEAGRTLKEAAEKEGLTAGES
jgi:ElaB/YqjD/DUF883 family membrane-anchored ribosome-binding protein